MAELAQLTIHTDGAARGNPGSAAYAYVIVREGQPPIEEAGLLGETTNNQAEYTALVKALEHALDLGRQHRVVVHSDSELMVKQLNGEYRVKNGELRPLYEEAMQLQRQFTGGVSFVHVRRAQNQRADELCNEALDGKRGCTRPKATAPKQSDLEERAVNLLREAGAVSPREVWQRLLALLREHEART
jgi:ribonuclease HI